MAVETLKNKIKSFMNIDIVDMEGEINTSGNYLYLSGFRPLSPISGNFEFTLIIADQNFSASKNGLEKTLDQVIIDISEANLNKELIELGSMSPKRLNDLFVYELKINIEGSIYK